MIAKIVFVCIVLNQALCQRQDDVVVQISTLTNNETKNAPKTVGNLESLPNMSASHEVIINNTSRPHIEEEADQPPENFLQPTRLPHKTATSPPLVHKDNTDGIVATDEGNTIPPSTKPPHEVVKQTTGVQGTKKPDATPGTKEGKNGAAFFNSSLILVVSSAFIFRYLN